MTTFKDLGLNADLLAALDAAGYQTPTPIQSKAIPEVLRRKDVLGIAQTGTGKTAAFALPILDILTATRRQRPRKGARALVLSPTRELASQIADSFKTYGRGLDVKVSVMVGGVGHRPQRQAVSAGLDVLVATPGRLLDHMNEGNLSLSTTEVLVLDEADQMMDLGFIKPLRQIISKLPARRQGLFFSATMPKEIAALSRELLRDPVKVAVTPVSKTADRVSQKIIFVEHPKKRALLAELFADPALSRTLVFTRTKRGADRVAKHLESSGVAVAAIHGNKSQNQRTEALARFKNGKIRALIATDIAARGIDVDQVSHVVNFELPNIPESYVHRIGRTARAGAEGTAISFCDGEERAYLRDIERLTRQKIPAEDRRGDETLVAPALPPRRSPGAGAGSGEARKRQAHARSDRQGDGGSSKRNGGPRWKKRSGETKSAGSSSDGLNGFEQGRSRRKSNNKPSNGRSQSANANERQGGGENRTAKANGRAANDGRSTRPPGRGPGSAGKRRRFGEKRSKPAVVTV